MNLSQQAARRGYFLLKKVNQAIDDFQMIDDGDRVAVATSGGKDSLCLLTLLSLRQHQVRQRYELVAIHVHGNASGLDCAAHPALANWLQAQDYAFVIEPMDLPPGEPLPLPCHRCTRHRRKTIFQIADRLGCRVVAFAHNMVRTNLIRAALRNVDHRENTN